MSKNLGVGPVILSAAVNVILSTAEGWWRYRMHFDCAQCDTPVIYPLSVTRHAANCRQPP
jgi:hypothetical protein